MLRVFSEVETGVRVVAAVEVEEDEVCVLVHDGVDVPACDIRTEHHVPVTVFSGDMASVR